MSQIFLSHSSSDNAEAIALRDWLASQGFNDIFLDLDPERGLKAGERWEGALNAAANRCEAVVFLISKDWIASSWCRKEMSLAHRLNKRMFAAVIEDLKGEEIPNDLTGEWQFVRLASGRDGIQLTAELPVTHEQQTVTFSREGLNRLRHGLESAGLNPRYFAWPPVNSPDRPPYRGLLPLEAEDAGIFFGRDAAIVTALDALRGLREAAPPRLFMILGASGAGKSSMLRAGLLPRLARDDRHFLPLPVIRPDRAAITGESGLLRGLETVLKNNGLTRTRADLRKVVGQGTEVLARLLRDLANKRMPTTGNWDTHEQKPPSLVFAIDQGEELFNADSAEEARQFFELIAGLAGASELDVIVVFTIRTDAYEPLQSAQGPAAPLADLKQVTYSLPPMAKGAYESVIEGPAQRLKSSDRKLDISAELTAKLLADIEDGGGKDALPLLAFTLERLYLEHGADGTLTLADYEVMGGIRGAIEAAVERAFAQADNNPKIPRDRNARLNLLRRGLIPWLAGIDPDSGKPRRKVALLSQIPEESRSLIDLLVEARLLATDTDDETGEATIEPAHEALLRQWGLLEGWLEEDFSALASLEAVRRAARDWEANAMENSWLAHTGTRLEDAERFAELPAFQTYLNAGDMAYLGAARKSEMVRRKRERSLNTAVRAAAVMACIGLAIAGWQWTIAREAADAAQSAARIAEHSRAVEQETRFQAQTTESGLLANAAAAAQGDPMDITGPTRATLLALEALPDKSLGVERPLVSEAWRQLDIASKTMKERLIVSHEGAVDFVSFSVDDHHLLTASSDGTARIWSTATGQEIVQLVHRARVRVASFSFDGSRVVTASDDNTARIWDAESGAELRVFQHSAPVVFASFVGDGKRVVTASSDHTARVWDAVTGLEIATFEHGGPVFSAQASSDGRRVISAANDDSASIWDAQTGVEQHKLRHKDTVVSARFSRDDMLVATASHDGTAAIWDANTGERIASLYDGGLVQTVEFDSSGHRLVTASFGGAARIWDVRSGKQLAEFRHEREVTSATFNDDGTMVATSSLDGTACIWDVSTGRKLGTFFHFAGTRMTAFGPHSSSLATASDNGLVHLFDLNLDLTIARFEHARGINEAIFSDDGRWLGISSEDNMAHVWDLRTRSQVAYFKHTSALRVIRFDNAGNRFLTVAGDEAMVWDVHSGELLKKFVHESFVTRAAINADGSRILTVSPLNVATLWESLTGRKIAQIDLGAEISSVSFSMDGKKALLTTVAGTVDVIDSDLGKALTQFQHRTEFRFETTASFSPDGNRVVSNAGPETVIWDVATAQVLQKILLDPVVAMVTFSADGSSVLLKTNWGSIGVWNLASGNTNFLTSDGGYGIAAAESAENEIVAIAIDEKTVGVWSLQSGEKFAEYRADIPIRSISIGPSNDADTITIAIITDREAVLWPIYLQVQTLVDNSKKRVARCLTLAERKQYFLPAVPPRWCITGAGLEQETDPEKWKPKWPYHTKEWRDWLAARDRGEEVSIPSVN